MRRRSTRQHGVLRQHDSVHRLLRHEHATQPRDGLPGPQLSLLHGEGVVPVRLRSLVHDVQAPHRGGRAALAASESLLGAHAARGGVRDGEERGRARGRRERVAVRQVAAGGRWGVSSRVGGSDGLPVEGAGGVRPRASGGGRGEDGQVRPHERGAAPGGRRTVESWVGGQNERVRADSRRVDADVRGGGGCVLHLLCLLDFVCVVFI